VRGGDRDARFGVRGSSDRKTQQLCREVQETLTFVLAGECDDPVLERLAIESVTPAPDASRLLVRLLVAPDPDEGAGDAIDVAEIEAHLERVRGKLRAEIAAAIHRKKTPQLAFQIVLDASRAERDD